MRRSFYDPPDPFDLLEREAALEEIARRKELVRRAEQALAEDAVRRAEVAAAMTARTMDYHRRHVLQEYLSAGVKPPFVDIEGNPTFSLSFLLLNGWTIEEVSGVMTWIKPVRAKPPERDGRRQQT